ncbi:hypothetical protein GCM10027091_42530 [Streptomyces daliensis]
MKGYASGANRASATIVLPHLTSYVIERFLTLSSALPGVNMPSRSGAVEGAIPQVGPRGEESRRRRESKYSVHIPRRSRRGFPLPYEAPAEEFPDGGEDAHEESPNVS